MPPTRPDAARWKKGLPTRGDREHAAADEQARADHGAKHLKGRGSRPLPEVIDEGANPEVEGVIGAWRALGGAWRRLGGGARR
jgi:hypothetical protein